MKPGFCDCSFAVWLWGALVQPQQTDSGSSRSGWRIHADNICYSGKNREQRRSDEAAPLWSWVYSVHTQLPVLWEGPVPHDTAGSYNEGSVTWHLNHKKSSKEKSCPQNDCFSRFYINYFYTWTNQFIQNKIHPKPNQSLGLTKS